MIRCQIPYNATDDGVTVRVFHRERKLGVFDVRSADDRILDDANIKSLSVFCLMRLTYKIEPSSPPKQTPSLGFKHTISGLAAIESADSTLAEYTNGSLSDTRSYRLALFENLLDKTVSGTIALQTTDGMFGHRGILEHRFTIKNVPYTRVDGVYKLTLLGTAMKEGLIGIESVFFDNTDQTVWTLIDHNFETGPSELTFEIKVR
jgi:hypothetical protein